MASEKKVIGLFGGTFDPVHIGHVTVSRSYLDSNLIDELWLLLTPHPPHKTEQDLSSYLLRKQMLETAFRDYHDIKICDLETRLSPPSYTVQTLRHLHKKYSKNTFYLCIGEDSLNNFKTWYRWEEILTYCDLLVARRPNDHVTQADEQVLGHVHFVEHEPIEVSSSDVRQKIARQENVSDQLPEGVEKIIEQHQLYREK